MSGILRRSEFGLRRRYVNSNSKSCRRPSPTPATSGKRSVATLKTVGCRSTTTSANEHSATKRSGGKTGCSWGAVKPDRGRPSCSRFWPAPSATESNRGPTCANCCSASMTITCVSTRCYPTSGRRITPKPSSPIGSKNPAAKPPHAARAVVTPAPRAEEIDQRRDTMPRPDAYSKFSFLAKHCSIARLPRPAVASFWMCRQPSVGKYVATASCKGVTIGPASWARANATAKLPHRAPPPGVGGKVRSFSWSSCGLARPAATLTKSSAVNSAADLSNCAPAGSCR